MVRVFDTLADGLVELVPREEGKVSMYVCGPTVYDVPHLGHARSALVFDVVRRYLTWRGFTVTFAMNVTDVDDKIIARASREHSTEPEIAATYEQFYWDQMGRLGIPPPDHCPHATGYVEKMTALIGEIVGAGRAYVVDGSGVYFDVEGYGGVDGAAYGLLPHRTIEQLRESAGARVEVDEDKRSPLDFALWKAAKPGEPAWASPWGPGRPGWHIECAAMSLDLLGERFDVHGGGKDLAFPHHENERVEAEAAGHPFARYWLHNGHVVIEGEKMSKSLGNFITLQEGLEQYDPRALRMAALQTHYRTDIEMGRAELSSAAEAVGRLDALARRCRSRAIVPTALDEEVVARFREAMDDDFNTPEAMAAVFGAVRRANTVLDTGDEPTTARLFGTVVDLTSALGLELSSGAGSSHVSGGGDVTATGVAIHVEDLIAQRDEARRAKDFAEADRIRDELAERGIILEDTPAGTIWHRGPSGDTA